MSLSYFILIPIDYFIRLFYVLLHAVAKHCCAWSWSVIFLAPISNFIIKILLYETISRPFSLFYFFLNILAALFLKRLFNIVFIKVPITFIMKFTLYFLIFFLLYNDVFAQLLTADLTGSSSSQDAEGKFEKHEFLLIEKIGKVIFHLCTHLNKNVTEKGFWFWKS